VRLDQLRARTTQPSYRDSCTLLRVITRTTDVSTNWLSIWALFLAGCTLAVHVGKFPAALPLLVEEFDLTLAQTGNLVSVYALLIACGALFVGFMVARIGYVLFATTGIALCMTGSVAGAYADTLSVLMLSRIVEGLGWLAGVVALPSILNALAAPKDRPVVMGLWGSFMPIGGGGMLFLAPVFQSIGGWQLSWTIAGVLSLLGVVTISLVCRRERESLQQLRGVKSALNFGDLRKPESIAVMLCFLCYSFQYASVSSFLPILLVQESGLQLTTAAFWAAVAMLANAVGNIAAGWIINAGIKRHHILSCASLLMGLFAWIMLSFPDAVVKISAGILMSALSGAIPGTLFSTSALVASSAAGVGIIIGFMLTGTGLGQLLGPIALTRVVDWTGHWYSGGVLNFCIGLLGVYFAFGLKRLPAERSSAKTL